MAVPVRVPESGVEVAPAPEPGHLWVRAYVRNPWRNPSLAADFSLQIQTALSMFGSGAGRRGTWCAMRDAPGCSRCVHGEQSSIGGRP